MKQPPEMTNQPSHEGIDKYKSPYKPNPYAYLNMDSNTMDLINKAKQNKSSNNELKKELPTYTELETYYYQLKEKQEELIVNKKPQVIASKIDINEYGMASFKNNMINKLVTNEVLVCIVDMYPKIVTLCLNDCIKLTDISPLSKLNYMTDLYLTRSTGIEDISVLSKCTNLEFIDMEGCNKNIKEEDVLKIRSSLPKLRKVYID